MQTLLYHKELGFPRSLHRPTGTMPLNYSKHAIEAAQSDRYGKIHLPFMIDLNKCELIEVETSPHSGAAIKYVVRTPYDSKRDLTLVVLPNGFVKTVWFNAINDKHVSLKKERYVVPV